MGVLDKVNQLRQQGYTEQQITQALMEENISPKDIREAIDQSNIKSAVNMPDEQMQESIMATAREIPAPGQTYQQDSYQQHYQQTSQPSQNYPAQQSSQNYPVQQAQNYPAQYAEAQYQEYPQQQYQYSGMDNVSEIAEEIVAEKMSEVKKQMLEVMQIKKILQGQISNIEERLKRIESVIDNMQMQIIGKIAGYGKDIQGINKEMQLMQSSFSNMINPVIDKARQEAARQETKKKDNFNQYVRK